MSIFEIDKIRYKLLIEVYQQADANIRSRLDFNIIGNKFKLENNEIDKAYHYLLNENFIEPMGSGYYVVLTHVGIKKVESFLRKINFDNNIEFNSTELYQLQIILQEIKDQIKTLELGQEVIFNYIDEVFEQSKTTTKKDWREYFQEQIKNWATQKILDYSAKLIIESVLVGLKIYS